MTIKEFAKLCNCNPQTLRYYDKEDLLKPNAVDSWTGYRYYSKEQAIDFVKIKNLQEADFSIKEIKELLMQSDEEIYQAFDKKIEEQFAKLEKIRKIQTTYLSEKHSMEAKIRKIKEQVMVAAREYDSQEEFGITQEYYDQLMKIANEMFEASINHIEELNTGAFDLEPGEGTDIAEEPKKLSPLKDNAYTLIHEKHGWRNTKEVMENFSLLENGEYILCFDMEKSKIGNIAFGNLILGYILDQNKGKNLQLECRVGESDDNGNHFWLLKAK